MRELDESMSIYLTYVWLWLLIIDTFDSRITSDVKSCDYFPGRGLCLKSSGFGQSSTLSYQIIQDLCELFQSITGLWLRRSDFLCSEN